MDFKEILDTIQNAVRTVFRLREFFDTEIAEMLGSLGDSEFQEAIKSLQYANEDNDSESHIQDAALFLRSAKTKYLEVTKCPLVEEFFSGVVESLPVRYFFKDIFQLNVPLAYQKACMSMLLAATCYKRNDQTTAMIESIDEAKSIFDKYTEFMEYAIPVYTKSRFMPYHKRMEKFKVELKQQREKFLSSCNAF